MFWLLVEVLAVLADVVDAKLDCANNHTKNQLNFHAISVIGIIYSQIFFLV